MVSERVRVGQLGSEPIRVVPEPVCMVSDPVRMAITSDTLMLHADSQAGSHARCNVCICISLAPHNLHEQCIHQTCQSACHAVKSGQSMRSMQGAE